jgi:hypothetical protein
MQEGCQTWKYSRPSAVNADSPPFEQAIWADFFDVGDIPKDVFDGSESRGCDNYEVERRTHSGGKGRTGEDGGGRGRTGGEWGEQGECARQLK